MNDDHDTEDPLEILDGPTELAPPVRIPTVYSNEPTATYHDWRPADTRVITCRIGNDLYPGERFESRDEALEAVKLRYGRVLEANYVPGRAFFRVQR
jgi:hypothetical protein